MRTAEAAAAGGRGRPMRIAAMALLSFLAVAGLGASGSAAAERDPLLAFAARIAGDDARTRIVIDFEEKPEFSIHYVAGPERIVVDLPATVFGFPHEDLAARGLFSDIRFGTLGEDRARVLPPCTRPVRLGAAGAPSGETGEC